MDCVVGFDVDFCAYLLLSWVRKAFRGVGGVKESMVQRSLLLCLVVMVTWTGQGVGQWVLAWQEPLNLLQNPGFEGDYFPWFGINEVQVAHGWTPWWRQRTEADPPAFFFKPEYKQANGYIFPNRVHSGVAAQQWFTFHATHEAGMYQQVFGVTPGTRYRFTIWAQVWSSTEDNASVSVNPAYPNLQAGIDVTGGWNPWAGTVVWSGTAASYDSWGQLGVEAVAQSDVITVFMRSNPNWPVKHNDVYWDDAVLVAVGVGGEPIPPTATLAPPPSPTATAAGAPALTATPTAPPPPTPTCAPAPEDWVAYRVQRGDTLYALATRSGTTLDMVIAVNCLSTTTIFVGQELLLPESPITRTPSAVTSTATPVPATVTSQPSATLTPAASATPSEAPATATFTTMPATATPVPVAAATISPTAPQPTIAPSSTSVVQSATPTPSASAASGGSNWLPVVIVGGAGVALLAGIFGFWRRRRPV
jgi:LysM repeat protein